MGDKQGATAESATPTLVKLIVLMLLGRPMSLTEASPSEAESDSSQLESSLESEGTDARWPPESHRSAAEDHMPDVKSADEQGRS